MPKKHLLKDPYRPGDEDRLRWFDAGLARFIMATFFFWEKYFRYEVVGLENVPSKGGVLFALNHGFFFIDLPLFAKQLLVKTGRSPRAVAEHLSWRLPVLREVLLNLGIVDGNPKNAIRLLRGGSTVLVCPGGAREANRSSAHKYELMWNDRLGFVKVAMSAHVPILPAICMGIDDAYVMLVNGYKKWRGLSIPLPLFFGMGLMPFPAKLTHYVGRPVRPPSQPEAFRDPKKVHAFHRRVLREAERVKELGLAERGWLGLRRIADP